MKEYKVEMLQRGNWVMAHAPFGSIYAFKRISNVQQAKKKINECQKKWEDAIDLYPKYAKDLPTDYRILTREVSEWTVKEEN